MPIQNRPLLNIKNRELRSPCSYVRDRYFLNDFSVEDIPGPVRDGNCAYGISFSPLKNLAGLEENEKY
jgi:hypothetical protein